MRVIAGKARGTRLSSVKGLSTRPTGDRVKEALFNILGQKVAGSSFLDLFAGSGAIGLEALSRGAEQVIWVDADRACCAQIRKNLARTKLAGGTVYASDVFAALGRLEKQGQKFDIIFLDPPYSSTLIPGVLQAVHRLRLLRGSGLVVVEFSRHNSSWVALYPGVRLKKYGDTLLSFIDERALDAGAAEKEGQANGPDHV